MSGLIISGLLAILTLGLISLQKTYSHVPAKEIRRRARQGDEFANLVHKVVSYRISATVFLWLLVGISAASLFLVMARSLPWPLALMGIVSILWFGFAWLPNTRITAAGRFTVRLLSAPIAWILNYLHSPLEKAGLWVYRSASRRHHTGIYQKEDLIELIERQKTQADSRVTKDELTIAQNALAFGDMLVKDAMTPRSQVKFVNQSASVGPLLMDDLYKSGHSRFPVYKNKRDNLVGMLYLHDLVNSKQSKTVEQLVHNELYYIHEEQTLYQALQVFIKTRRHLCVAVNGFEEIVGVITIEDVLEQIVGVDIVDEFDQYDNLREVAAAQAKQKHDDSQKSANSPE